VSFLEIESVVDIQSGALKNEQRPVCRTRDSEFVDIESGALRNDQRSVCRTKN
jgi:hypothetical protein